MKKFFVLTLILAMLTCTACGDKASEEKSSDDSSAENNKSESEVIESSEQETIAEESEEKPTEERFYDFNGLNMHEPDGLVMMPFGDDLVWGYDHETTEQLNYAIVINSLNYAEYNDPSTYGLDDVWEILSHELELNIGTVYYDIAEFYDAEADTTEKVDFLGAEFIRSTGIIPFRTYDDEHVEINYAAYYGILDFPAYGNYPECKSVPVMWIAFSDVNSAEMKAEMEKIVDDVAENASWLSDEQ